jgi:hypothetical protein
LSTLANKTLQTLHRPPADPQLAEDSAGGRFCVPLREKEVSPWQRIETLHVLLT